jgi:hypothetical protein
VGGRYDSFNVTGADGYSRGLQGLASWGPKLVSSAAGHRGGRRAAGLLYCSADGNVLAVGGPNDSNDIGATWMYALELEACGAGKGERL